MDDATPCILEVSPTANEPAFRTISSALARTSPGDTIYVRPGRYTQAAGESFPLFIPPGVSLVGAEQTQCCIDGRGAMAVSTRPIQSSQSLVLLGDRSSISGFTITGSGGHGVAAQPLASTKISDTCIENNGQHGLFVPGPTQTIVRNNWIRCNGTKRTLPSVPRCLPNVARQGHNILFVTTARAANQIYVVDNILQNAFADGVAIYADFDETNPVTSEVYIAGNQIEENERFGILVAGSFGPSDNRASVELRDNILRANQSGAIDIEASLALIDRVVRRTHVTAKVIGNRCEQSPNGIFLSGGFGPAVENVLEVSIACNQIDKIDNYAIRAIAGVGFEGGAACDNQLRLSLGHNKIGYAGRAPILLQGAVARGNGEVKGNRLQARIFPNEVSQFNSQQPVSIDDGLPGGNVVSLLESALPYCRQEGMIPL